jgi:hypothetical protein
MVSDILACVYRGDLDGAKKIAAARALDLFEAAALGDADRVAALVAADGALVRARSAPIARRARTTASPPSISRRTRRCSRV